MKIKKTKQKPGRAAPAASDTPPHTVEYRRERREIPIREISGASWNPRTRITPESVADLTASIASLGLIQPLVAMERTDGAGYTLIAGHRRLVAAKEAGLNTVLCDVLLGIDEATARRMTFIENLQRKDTEPLLESELVISLVADGMTQEEIAAEIGRNRKWVMRRLNLSRLSPSWRKRVASGESITIDCLEHVAAYPQEIQERLKDVEEGNADPEYPLRWDDIEFAFDNFCRDLDKADFDTSACKECAKRTGANPDLFDWSEDEEKKPLKLGQCLDAKCYACRAAEFVSAAEAAAEKAGAHIVRKRPGYGAKTSPKRTNKYSVLYVWTDDYGDRRRHCAWAEPPPYAAESQPADTDAAAAAYEADKKRQLAETKTRNKAIHHLAQICTVNDNLAKWIVDAVDDTQALPFLLHHMFYGLDSYRLAGTDTEISVAAYVAYSIGIVVPAKYYRTIADKIIAYLDPSRNSHAAYHNARLIIALYPQSKAQLAAPEIAAIESAASLPCSDPEKAIVWEGQE